MLVVPNAAETTLLTWMLDADSTPEDLTLKLYKTDVTPTASSTAGSFTEADFTGYESKDLERGSWGTAASSDGVATIPYGSTLSWTASSSQTIYGYFVVGKVSGDLYWAEKFATARSLSSSDELNVLPKFSLDTMTE